MPKQSPTECRDAGPVPSSCASPAILGVTANISQDGSSVQAHTPGIRQGLCPPPGTGKEPPLAVQMASEALGQKRAKVGEGGGGGGNSRATVSLPFLLVFF